MKGGEITDMKKSIILPALAIVALGGVFTLGQQSKAAHAAGPAVVSNVEHQVKQEVATPGEKPEASGTVAEVAGKEVSDKGSEAKGSEADGPGGHQDPQGANVDHQFNGAE